MESFKILIKRSAAGELSAGIPKRDLEKIILRIRELAENPRPSGCRKLSARNLYRVRQGDYRIVYLIDDAERFVTILKVGHRGEIYRTS
jgi:mRNA interferase RelE/StbE